MAKPQPGDLISGPTVSQSDGSMWYDQGNVFSDGNGNLNTASITSSQEQGGQDSSAQVIATSGTLQTSGRRVIRATPAAAVTGVGLQAGTQPGQEVTVINESAGASTIAYTTNVATAFTQSGATSAKFVWDSSTNLWYHCV